MASFASLKSVHLPAKKKALNCAVGLLAKKLGRNYTSVRANYYGQKDNFNVKQLEN